ncbi:uncharacterized protein LOC132185210 [Corylus avellana]|uniref:uncharacterized protein LOC132185210 n=1 Tax=Corylus avellana TaxID=13451 RepID=UPI00286A1B34|nr:uncharacterized protein LOC132185210 [Corylus avellana]
MYAQHVLQDEEDNVNVGVVHNCNVGVEDNAHDRVHTMPETAKNNKRHGRPRKTKVIQDIDEVIKELLSDCEVTNGEDEELYYDADEVNKEKDGTSNWWKKVDYNINDKKAEFGDDESEDERDGLVSLQGSDFDSGKNKKRYRQFNEKHDLKIPVKFGLEDQFVDIYSFKRALKLYVVQNGFDYNYKHNDFGRVSAICRETHCAWRIHASIDATRNCIQIKTFYLTHTCGNQYENTRYDVYYMICTYKKDFKDDPTWTPAKNEALHQLFSSYSKQYRLIRRYASAVRSTNPGSSAFIQRERAFFQRMYICLDACKKGFKHGCWPIICLDACHLKGEYVGQLLCAIGKDGNDHMFPIAFAVAEAETKESWQWFITILLEDLCGSEGGLGWTIMSDRQKGLRTTVDVVLPHAEHRVCVRHLHANFKARGCTGKAFKDEL